MGNKEKRKQRARQKRKALARQRHAQAKTGSQTATLPASLPRTPPNRFTVHYADPSSLQIAGPLVVASWSVPPAKETLLKQAGRSVPSPVTGHMLLDTGANGNCMALEVATNELGLTPVDYQETYGVHGKQKNEVFEAALTLTITDSFGTAMIIRTVQRVLGVPDLEKLFASGGVKVGNQPIRIIGLLGREFLRHATLIYKGSSGSFEVIIDTTAMQHQPTLLAP